MQHIVIVSSAVKQGISVSESSRYNIISGDDPASLFTQQKDQRHAVLFIASPDELENILSVIPSGREQIASAIYLFANDSDTIPADNTLIAGVRFQPFSSDKECAAVIETAFASIIDRYTLARERESGRARLDDMLFDQEALIRIGRSLSTEKDQNTLLRMILMLSKEITGADAGSIYITEQTEKGKQIRFKYSHTFSKDLPLEEFVLPYDTNSITGYVAVRGTVLNIPDVNLLTAKDPVSFNNSFDKANGYRSKSMLVVPMRNHLDEIIGVIQLINSKEDVNFPGNEAFGIKLITNEDFDTKVVPFDGRYEHLMEAVAGQAAIAIENNRMIVQIQSQFEAFVKASVTAIESRDPATSGHSFRVAEICTIVAHAVSESTQPPFATVTFSDTQIKELEYAALLHDFGKVYIDLGIFKKAKKLFPRDFENLLLKLDYLYRYVELNGIIEENSILLHSPQEDAVSRVNAFSHELQVKLERIKEIKYKVSQLDEPTIMDDDPAQVLSGICNEIDTLQCSDIDGKEMPIFSDLEKTNLSIKRGSLNEEERREIESHVTQTYNFVSRIPWPPEFKDIPEIALGHHEKLDGSGYPLGKKGDGVSMQSRIMAIADIYDALTATDRPYKKAIPHEKALMILQKESDAGKIDPDLFKIFCSCDIDQRLNNKDLPKGV